MDLTASVKIDAKETFPLEEKVFGHFIEHFGRCIKFGIWDERDGVASDYEFGRLRRDVFEAMAELRPPVLRWPGGCFSDTYHWQDGIGPAEQRPRRFNRAWFFQMPPWSVFDNNHFGTDEFMELCRRLGAEPYINVNFGSGTPREAARWVEYCNAPAGSGPAADLRADYGHPEPYNVKYWGIANEIWGIYEAGYCPTGRIYARKYKKFHKEMKAADESIECVAVGANRTFPNWNRQFLSGAAAETDFLSLHEYTPGAIPFSRSSILGIPKTREAYYTMLSGADQYSDSIKLMRKHIESVDGEDSRIKIAFDEWNAWWSGRQSVRAEDFTLREGILVASTLCRLISFSPIMVMANISQFVNAIGIITSYKDGVVRTPSHQAFKLCRDAALDTVLKTVVECDTVASAGMGVTPAQPAVTLVDAAATRDSKSGALSLIIVNKHYDEPISAEVSFKGFKPGARAAVSRLYTDNPSDLNTLKQPDKVAISRPPDEPVRKTARFNLPPHSVSAFKFSPADV